MVIAAHSNDPQLDTLVASIVDRVRPELILLFGSRARGEAHEDSDYDLMLVVPDGVDAESSRKTAYDLRSGLKLDVDILARTTSEYLRRQNDPGFLDWLVSREGLLLYSSGKVPQRSSRSDRVREEPADGVHLWIARAESDFQETINSIGSAKPSWDAICFHAHASIEKLLKAIVISQGTFPPRTHKLAALLEMVPRALRDDPQLIAACGFLQSLYPKSRYEPEPMPTPDEARSAFDAARAARERLLKQLKDLE
jgi:HEPN domain-containing protein/predicted nucleotidyltransferase